MFGTLRFKATFPWSDMTQVWRRSLTSCVLCSSVSSSDLRSWLWLSSDCSVCTRSVRAAMFRFPSDEDALSPSTRSWKTQDITQSFLLNSLSLRTSISLRSPAAVCVRSQPVPASSAAQRDAPGWRCGRQWLPAGSGRERALALSERSLRPELWTAIQSVCPPPAEETRCEIRPLPPETRIRALAIISYQKSSQVYL